MISWCRVLRFGDRLEIVPGLLEEPVPAPPSAEYETLERPIEEGRNLRRPVLTGADCLNPAVQNVDLLEEGSDQLALSAA